MSTKQPLMCPTCNLDYTTWGQYEEHFWSMIHHKQLEIQYGSGKVHMCSLCNAQTDSLSSYAKHLVSDVHCRAVEKRRISKQLQTQHNQRNLRMIGPRYSQTYQGGWMRGAWEQNQRKIWPRYFDRNHYNNPSQNRMWSAKMDFEVTGPHSSSRNPSSQSSFSKSSASSSVGIKPGSCQTKTPCLVKHTAGTGADKGTCKTGITKSAIEVIGHSSGVKSPTKQNNTKERTLGTTIKATSKLIIQSKTDPPSENISATKSSSHVTSSTLKSTTLNPSFKTSVLSRRTDCKSSCTGDQDKNGKKRIGSTESEKHLKYQNCEPSTSTPAIGESTGVKSSVSCLKYPKSEDKQGQEKSTDQKKSTSSQKKTIELSVANESENRTNTNIQSNVIKRATEFGTDFDLKKARRMDMSQTPDGISKISAAGEIRTSVEETKRMLDLSEENVIKEVEENLTSDGTSKTDSHMDEEHVSIQSAPTKASTAQACSISKTCGKSSDLNSVALPSSPVDGKSQNTLAIGKAPPEVTRLNLPQSNPEVGEKDPMSGTVMPSEASSEDPLESIELSGEASVTRVQLPPSLQRELTKLLVKSQGPRPRPNLAAARSRLHAGEHPQAQVVESPDRMIQQLLMKLLDSPKSRDRQVQQIEELQRLLIQASKKGSERARFGVQQLPEISLDVLESLLKSGQLKPLLSEDGMESDQNHPMTLHANELADSKEQPRRPFLANSPVNKPHPERDTTVVIKQETVESETHVKTEPLSPVPNKITIKSEPIKSEPDLDAAAPTDRASSIQTMPSPPQTPSTSIHREGGSGTDKVVQIKDVRSLSCTPQSVNPKEVRNLPTEADNRQQPVLPKAPSRKRNSEPVLSNLQASPEKVSQKTPRKRRTTPLDLKDILLKLSLKEERFHKKLITVESSLRTTKELISKKQKHVKKLKEQRKKISQDVTAIRMERLQLLKEATTSSLLSPASQKSLTKACRRKCQKLTSQASRQRSSSVSTPVSGLLTSLIARSSNSCPVTDPFKTHATSVACTNPSPVTNISFRGSSVQGKSQGPSGQTLFQGPVSSTVVVSGAKPRSKLPQRFAAGSSLQNSVKFQSTSTESSLSRPLNNPYNIQTTTKACTNPYSATKKAPTYKVSFREGSLQDKSQGPAGQTLFQGSVPSTPVSASGSKLRRGRLISIPNTGSYLKFLTNIPLTIHPEATVAGSAKKSNTTSDSVDKPQQVKGKVEPIDAGSSLSCPVSNPFKIQATSVACTNPCPVTNSTTTNTISFRGNSLQDKSQGPAGRTLFRGSVSSTPVSASGSRPRCGPLSIPTTGSFYISPTLHAEATVAGSAKKSNTTSDSVDKPQQVKGKVEPIDAGSSISCPLNNPFKIQATSEACTNPCPVTNSTTSNTISFRESSLQDKSQGPAGRTLFRGSVSSTPVSASGSKPRRGRLISIPTTGSYLKFLTNIPLTIHPEATVAGSAKKSNTTSDSVDKPQQVKGKVEPIDAGSSRSCPVNNPFKIQATSEACTNPCPVTNSTTSNTISFRGNSLQDKSQGPAGRTLLQGSVSSTPVSASGSRSGRGPLSIPTTFYIPPTIHAEATVAGSAKKSNTTSDSVDKPQQVEVKVEPTDKVKVEPIDKVKVEPIDKVKVEPIDEVKVEPIDEVKVEPIDKVKVEPIDPGYQDVGDASLQAALVPLPETSLFEHANKTRSSLFGTSTSSNTLLDTGIQGQSRGKKQIIGDISNTEQTNQDHQATTGTKRKLCRNVSACSVSKRARTTEGLKEVLAKAKSPRSEVGYPTRSAVSTDTSTLEVPSAHKKTPQWMPVLKLHKIDHQGTRPIVTKEKSSSVTTDEGKGSSTTLDFSVFEISSDSESSATVEPITSRVKSSSRIYPKLSALRTHSPSPQSAFEHHGLPEAKCGLFRAHCKAVRGMCNVRGRLCTVSADKTARVFNIKDFSCHKDFSGHHGSSVNCASTWSYRDTDYLFTGSSDETVRIYNMQTFACEKVIFCNSRVMCLLLRWETMYAGLANGCVTVINLKDFTTETLRCKRDVLIESMITASYKGKACLVIAYSDNTVGVHSLADGNQHVYLKGHTKSVLCLGVLNHQVYSGSADRKVLIHDMRIQFSLRLLGLHFRGKCFTEKMVLTGKKTKTIKHHGNAVTALIVSSLYLITASLDKKVRLFSAQNGKLGRVIAECPYMISCMIRIKKMLYVGYTNGYVEAIDVKPNSTRTWSVTKKPKEKPTMFDCEWFDCGVQVKTSKSSKHLNDYHIIRKKEHKCKWGYCDVVINKALHNCQELLWEHVKTHIHPQE